MKTNEDLWAALGALAEVIAIIDHSTGEIIFRPEATGAMKAAAQLVMDAHLAATEP